MNKTTLGKYNRSVSIIGVGCTPFMYTVDNPETDGLTEGEMFGYAALKAMEDAGVNPQDVDFYFHGQASPLNGSNYLTPNVQIANWFGMKGKGSIHHSEACCTGYLAIEQAVNAVASGKYNCVLTGCVEFGDSTPAPADNIETPKHPYKRDKMTMDKFLATTSWLYDRTYSRSLMAPIELIYDDAAEDYVRTRGISTENMDDALNWMAINNRCNAAKNPLAIERTEFADIAKEKGFDNVMDYMRSPYNPKMGDFLRMEGVERKCDGAAACIVCATDMIPEIAKDLAHKPIEVLGIGSAACEASTPHFEIRATEEAVRQAYEVTGVKPEELDIFFANDFIITSHLISAEIAGYLPYGEGWKYICDGRTAYDGDKPINTNGGRTSFGHAHAASGLADVYEACMQMRGECGERQVKKLPKTAMLRGYGGAQNVAAVLLRTKE
ncbi:thiolase family protein [Clostridium sp. C105KSO13]|uniref:thiolase family protein n=1 Tax=Clostridium sp. C105KSO13 TaxID=1776045 RepID=UPI0007406B78|nr:thiolase family protein [Clostridium sp. C105KSO13]CUX18807.1 acetyl-CoA acetyltransferase [Clostridium sp. C105KSO13]